MAAYAALLSLTHIIHDLETHHSPPISIDPQQLQSLSQILTSLLEFLENSKSPVADDGDEADPFEMRIADAAFAVEDVIESHLVNAIRTHHQQAAEDVIESHIANAINITLTHPQQNTSVASSGIKFYQDLQRVIEEMDLIKQMAVEMNTERAVAVHTHNASVSDVPLRSASSSSSTAMVCSDAVLYGLMDKLVGGRQDRLVIPIVGMGGIGKTTLALNIYECKTIKEHFVVRAWVTISQKYDTRELMSEVLAQITNQKKGKLGDKSENEVKEELYQCLFGRRFLIVMDDMWSIDAWEKIQRYFPNNDNGSRIMVTTRLSQLSSQLNPNFGLQMEFLDQASSWKLFSKTVFGERSCPPKLKKIGEEIVENCRGLPLSIVAVGGLLKKMAHTLESWESIRDNLTSIVNLDNDKHCLRLLKLSYNHLPVYLKPCFLYMGLFEEDDKIRVSTIIKLWVSEGFLKPVNDRSLEAVAREFLKDLADRNLILIDRIGCTGYMKTCKIHDLLRDLCLKEGEKEGFYHAIGKSQDKKRQCCRIVIPNNTSKEEVVEGLQSMSHVRSVICENGKVPACPNFGLLRTFHAYKFRTFDDKRYINSAVFQYVNLRHLAVEVRSRSSIFNSLNHFWNLHTLIVSCENYKESITPTEIWKMPQLRHIEFPGSRVCLPDPPPSDKDKDVVIMENLQVIKGVKNFKCSEEVVKRIPNLKKLKTQYWELKRFSSRDGYFRYCVINFRFLSKLEHLSIFCERKCREAPYWHRLNFPKSLKSLSIVMNDESDWEKIIETIGSLPHLEKLTLGTGWFRSGKWEMVEGQFQELRYLKLAYVSGLKQWIVEDSSVLPRLERLTLSIVQELEEFPIEIGNITTLEKVEIDRCGEAVVRSAREMVDEQVDLQGDQLSFHVHVEVWFKDKEALQKLTTPNFTVV